MATIQPPSDALKRAVKWISECLKSTPNAQLFTVIQDAVLRFDLSPRDEQFLYQFYRQGNDPDLKD
jgi:hypothetical protein